jgi:hypothetical protein
MSDAEATLVPAGTAMYGLTELGGLVAVESVVVMGAFGSRPSADQAIGDWTIVRFAFA